MSKAYSNKALPPGTILREWRLENVLGVGGFGIVYKGRGIYFDELVAIKEYFPSSISERDEDATVVPIDSDAEEVHALGLKKFVEEAKLLWNLSTPSRHPNIVSVRSLFEIHGTAYMVMDFEEGVSLSKLIKSGTKWNEASLTSLIRPIAEGLERAHRVGVLHRDIKPPNILVNDDGRSVLIDFGSARFESGEATSTTVTFHTPPYAAIEQYVKTYEQGPWTDIYALGVVLYECITGTKPPEVLERMHGGLGKTLSEGDWPGYSKGFLAAVDAAMTIKPIERPQSISQWLALIDNPETAASAPSLPDVVEDDEATRIGTFDDVAEDFTAVAPPPAGFPEVKAVATAVPSDPKDVQFKHAGEDTGVSKKRGKAPEPDPLPAQSPSQEAAPAKSGGTVPPAKTDTSAKPKDAGPKKPAAAPSGKKLSPALIGGAALALVLIGGGGWYLASGGSGAKPDEAMLASDGAMPEETVAAVDLDKSGGIALAIQSLADDAAKSGIPAAAVKQLTDVAPALAKLDSELKALASDPAALKAKEDEMGTIARTASAKFSSVLVSEADSRARKLASDLPWANPRNPGASAGRSAEQQNVARDIRTALAALRSTASGAGTASDTAASLTFARQTMAKRGTYNTLIARAYRTKDGAAATAAQSSAATEAATTSAPSSAAPASAAAVSANSEPAKGSSEPATDSQKRQLKSVVDSAKDISKQVIRLGDRNKPGDGASAKEKEAYRVRQANVNTARDYERYLDTLSNSMRGARTKVEADQLITQANQTKGYLSQLLATSKASLN